MCRRWNHKCSDYRWSLWPSNCMSSFTGDRINMHVIISATVYSLKEHPSPQWQAMDSNFSYWRGGGSMKSVKGRDSSHKIGLVRNTKHITTKPVSFSSLFSPSSDGPNYFSLVSIWLESANRTCYSLSSYPTLSAVKASWGITIMHKWAAKLVTFPRPLMDENKKQYLLSPKTVFFIAIYSQVLEERLHLPPSDESCSHHGFNLLHEGSWYSCSGCVILLS